MERMICSKDIKLLEYAGSFRVRWDVSMDKDGVTTCIEAEYDHKPTMDEIKTLIIGYYNDQCNQKILSGFSYEGSSVWLSVENQFNYKAAFDVAFQTIASGREYTPVTFKFGTDSEPVYKTFETFDVFQSFYSQTVIFINQTLGEFWQLKDSIKWEDYEKEF